MRSGVGKGSKSRRIHSWVGKVSAGISGGNQRRESASKGGISVKRVRTRWQYTPPPIQRFEKEVQQGCGCGGGGAHVAATRVLARTVTSSTRLAAPHPQRSSQPPRSAANLDFGAVVAGSYFHQPATTAETEDRCSSFHVGKLSARARPEPDSSLPDRGLGEGLGLFPGAVDADARVHRWPAQPFPCVGAFWHFLPSTKSTA